MKILPSTECRCGGQCLPDCLCQCLDGECHECARNGAAACAPDQCPCEGDCLLSYFTPCLCRCIVKLCPHCACLVCGDVHCEEHQPAALSAAAG